MADLYQSLSDWIRNNSLVSLTIVIPKEGPKRMNGRLLAAKEDLLLFYHDDEKQVYSVRFHEIDDIRQVA